MLDDDAADDNRRAVVVLSGTLLDEVTASGSVEFLELESMRFDISGNVGEILVAEQNDPESLRAVIQKLGAKRRKVPRRKNSRTFLPVFPPVQSRPTSRVPPAPRAYTHGT